jgi:hypothetical protein
MFVRAKRVLLALGLVAVFGMTIGLSEPAQALISCKVVKPIGVPPGCGRGKIPICSPSIKCTLPSGKTATMCQGYYCLPILRQ